VNTKADMERQLDLGVDGIITDYPTRLRTLMEERGMKLPKTYEPKARSTTATADMASGRDLR
jgi:glycerophosphoryl diester phosphodiesterase